MNISLKFIPGVHVVITHLSNTAVRCCSPRRQIVKLRHNQQMHLCWTNIISASHTPRGLNLPSYGSDKVCLSITSLFRAYVIV